MRLFAAILVVHVLLHADSFPASVSRYEGAWALVNADSDDIDQAVERTISRMSFLARPIARMKLKRRNVAFPRVTISATARGLHVQHQQGMDVLYPPGGQAVKARAPDATDVLTGFEAAPVLFLWYEADTARREDRYVLSADGYRLTLEVRLTAPRLPKPLVYKLAYRRVR